MPNTLNRRSFLRSSAAGLVAASATRAVASSVATRPVVIASGNGLTSRNGGELSCVESAFRRMVEGVDVLDALIGGVNIVELDPQDASVGFGGLPDADGVVTLDSCCMHGPSRRAGGVACLQGVRTPSLVARAVADVTDHHLLVGDGAQRFARNECPVPAIPCISACHKRSVVRRVAQGMAGPIAKRRNDATGRLRRALRERAEPPTTALCSLPIWPDIACGTRLALDGSVRSEMKRITRTGH
jgi:hypothetical protein